MAKRTKVVQALDGAAAIGEAQMIVRRLIEDEELREALGRAIESSRRVYERVSTAKKASKLLDDRHLHADVAEAYDAIRTVAVGLTGTAKSLPEIRRRKSRRGRVIVLAGVGGVAALAASEGLRSKVLDMLFGAEEEFEYSPPPAPPATEAPGSPLSAV